MPTNFDKPKAVGGKVKMPKGGFTPKASVPKHGGINPKAGSPISKFTAAKPVAAKPAARKPVSKKMSESNNAAPQTSRAAKFQKPMFKVAPTRKRLGIEY